MSGAEGHTPLLAVQHLSVRFGALRAVADVSFNVMANEMVGLVGPNGAGKTTTFNAISGLLPPTAGRVMLGPRDITGRAPEQIARAGITRTFQNVRLFAELSVIEKSLSKWFRDERRRMETIEGTGDDPLSPAERPELLRSR